jgi:hypothetical protein
MGRTGGRYYNSTDQPISQPLSEIAGQTGRIYLTARIADLILGAQKPPGSQTYRLTREDLKTCPNYRFYCPLSRSLTEGFPQAQFVRSASLYRGDRPKRWPAEKFGYSSLILAAFLSSGFSTGQTIIECPDTPITSDGKYRYIGAGCAREIADMVALGRPVCLIEVDDPPITYRVTDRFAVIPVLWPNRQCLAVVGEDQDAVPFSPDCSDVEAALDGLFKGRSPSTRSGLA